MNGKIRTTCFEVLEVVACPRLSGRRWSLERDVGPIRNLSCGRPFVAVALVVLLLADIVIRVT
jgi:hypothetical protein